MTIRLEVHGQVDLQLSRVKKKPTDEISGFELLGHFQCLWEFKFIASSLEIIPSSRLQVKCQPRFRFPAFFQKKFH